MKTYASFTQWSSFEGRNYYYNNRFMALWSLSGTTRVSRYQKGKTKTNVEAENREKMNDAESSGRRQWRR